MNDTKAKATANSNRFAVWAVLLTGVLGVTANAEAYLHPQIGRFVSRDPIGYADGMSLYQYVRSDPVGYVDPTGTTGAERSMWRNMIKDIEDSDDEDSSDLETMSMLEHLIVANGRHEYLWNTVGQTKDQMNWYDQAQKLRASLRSRLRIDAAKGFSVIETMEGYSGFDLTVMTLIGLGHVDVFYNGVMVREGLGGVDSVALGSPTKKLHWKGVLHKVTRLKFQEEPLNPYKLEAGKHKGTCCKDATDEQIADCLKKYSVVHGGGRRHINCQNDIVQALFGCCLEGYEAIGNSAHRGGKVKPPMTSENFKKFRKAQIIQENIKHNMMHDNVQRIGGSMPY
jgi:RHS repeat-associated protein